MLQGRDHRVSATMSQLNGGVVQDHVMSKAIGQVQRIDSVRTGAFKPGSFRANPVTIQKELSASTYANNEPVEYYSLKSYLRGQVAGYMAVGYAGIRTRALNCVAWNSSKADYSMNRAYSNLNSAELDVGVILGEMKETLMGIAQPLTALRKLLLQYRRWNVKRTDVINASSGTWLEFRYGIMPLISTIQDIMEQVDRQLRTATDKTLRAKGKVVWESRQKWDSSGYPGLFAINCTSDFVESHRMTTHIYYTYDGLQTWQQRYGVDLTSIPSILWELGTLTFVWDWLFGIGDWLQALKFDPNRTTVGTCTTHKVEVNATTTITKALLGGVKPIQCDSFYTYRLEHLERRVNLSKPLLPVVKQEFLSLAKTLDSLSLLWQKLPLPVKRKLNKKRY